MVKNIPKMPKFKDMKLVEKLAVNCAMREAAGVCSILSNCGDCPLGSVENYKKYLSQQPKQTTIKYPVPDKSLFFVLPRPFVNLMPNRWKKQFLKLLTEFIESEATKQSPYGYRVSVTKNGKFCKMPDVFKNLK